MRAVRSLWNAGARLKPPARMVAAVAAAAAGGAHTLLPSPVRLEPSERLAGVSVAPVPSRSMHTAAVPAPAPTVVHEVAPGVAQLLERIRALPEDMTVR